jgi:hypothetical protein
MNEMGKKKGNLSVPAQMKNTIRLHIKTSLSGIFATATVQLGALL